MSDAWRDKPASVGDVYDALISTAESATARAEAFAQSTTAHADPIPRELLLYATKVQTELLEEAAAVLKKAAGG